MIIRVVKKTEISGRMRSKGLVLNVTNELGSKLVESGSCEIVAPEGSEGTSKVNKIKTKLAKNESKNIEGVEESTGKPV